MQKPANDKQQVPVELGVSQGSYIEHVNAYSSSAQALYEAHGAGSADVKVLPEQIAICSVGELFGGVERHILALLGALRACGVGALLILFHDGELAAQARNQGFEPMILPNRNRFPVATGQAIAAIFKQQQIGIVHVHGYKATVLCTLARRWHRFEMVKTEHGLPELMSGRPLHVLRDRFYHILDAVATRMSASTVCYVTEGLRAHHSRAHAGLRTAVIPNGVAWMDKTRFKHPPELRQEWFNLAIVGRLDMVKGHHIAIEALSAQSMPPDVHLQIVGIGPRETPLQALAQRRGIADRVHFLGFRRNVYDYLAHCDVLLMPSLHEGLPYTLLEAMALGTPIVASRVGGLSETIENCVNGMLTPVSDSLALSNVLRELYDDPTLRKRLGENARRLQQAKYSVDAMALRYLAQYRAALRITPCSDHTFSAPPGESL